MDKIKISIIKNAYCNFNIKFNYFDIGAALPLNSFINNYLNMHFVNLFEPNYLEFKKLKKKYEKFNNINIYNTAISSKPKILLNIYDSANLSSTYKLDKSFNPIIKKCYLKKTVSLKAHRLSKYISTITDNVANTLKIDVQGMGLDCLKSLKKKIKYISVIIIESEIVNIYKNQDCGFEIDKYLYENNYLNLGTLCKYEKSIYKKNKKKIGFRELEYANDILYVKNFFKLNLGEEELINILFFLLNFNYYDLSEYVIKKKLKNNLNKKKLLKLLNDLKKLSIYQHKNLLNSLKNNNLRKKVLNEMNLLKESNSFFK